MGTWDQLLRKIQEGEGMHLEFKMKTSNVEKIMQEMVAFANTEGGSLLIGVSDNGELKGVKYPEEDIFIIQKMMSRFIQPQIGFDLSVHPISSKRSVIHLQIHESIKKPHFYYADSNSPGVVFIRLKDECLKASTEIYRLLKMKRRSKGQFITLGEIERHLLKLFEGRKEWTLSEILKSTKIKKRQASFTIVKLAAAGVLEIIPRSGKEDLIRELA